MSGTEVLRFSHVSIAYGEKAAARDISFTLSQGECLTIVGESGSGKTTLCKAILDLLPPEGRITTGDIDFQGQPLLEMSTKERRRLLGKEITTIFKIRRTPFAPSARWGVRSMRRWKRMAGLRHLHFGKKPFRSCKSSDWRKPAGSGTAIPRSSPAV